MKVVFICTDPATLDSRLPWPNVTRLAANSITDRRKLVEDADMVLIQGDFDYSSRPDKWDEMLTAALGDDFPVFASVGNHDS